MLETPNCAKMAHLGPHGGHIPGREGERRGKGGGWEGERWGKGATKEFLQCANLTHNPLLAFNVNLQSLPSIAPSRPPAGYGFRADGAAAIE